MLASLSVSVSCVHFDSDIFEHQLVCTASGHTLSPWQSDILAGHCSLTFSVVVVRSVHDNAINLCCQVGGLPKPGKRKRLSQLPEQDLRKVKVDKNSSPTGSAEDARLFFSTDSFLLQHCHWAI